LLDLRGNRALIAINCVNIILVYPGTKMYYIWRNKQRAKIWDAMTPEVCQYIVKFECGLADCF
jgi:hypothetical protein